MIQLYTIGFKEKPAQEFFELLKTHNVKRLIDIRLNNTSQLAGFTKSRDLKYFLKEICKADYIHKPELAPTKELLNDYKNKELTWNDYEIVFNKILVDRNINEMFIKPQKFEVYEKCYAFKKQFRGRFTYNDVQYDLPITDIFFLNTLNKSIPYFNQDNVYLTVSLGIEFEGWHYKLIAGVIIATK